MGYFQMPHYDWLEGQGIACSPFGREVAYIIGCTFGGIYNAPIDHDAIKWANERALSITIDRDISTFDFNRLTVLTLFAHEMCIRISINPAVKFFNWNSDKEEMVPHDTVCTNMDDVPDCDCCQPCLEIWFYKRKSREGNFSERHPTIEEALGDFRAAYKHPEILMAEASQDQGEA